MALWNRLMQASTAAVGAFREAMLDSDPEGDPEGDARRQFDAWNSVNARRARYRLSWALYQNNAYQDLLHRGLAVQYKAAFGLDKHVRHVYNPAYQLGEFWTSHLMGGRLDPAAGDGDAEATALPILTPHDRLRPPIARLWRDSTWQRDKEVYARWGAVLGDVGLRVVDDPKKGLVRLGVVHPAHLAWVDSDEAGNVQGYDLEKWAPDPRPASPDAPPRPPVRYGERVRRDGEKVLFRTTLNGDPYPWNGRAAEWEVPYGFVPLVVAHHEPLGGSEWAANCWHSGLSRFREVDDLGSKIVDHIRRASEAPMLLSGIKESDLKADRKERTDLSFLYGPPGATATHLVYNLDLQGSCGKLRMLLENIEKCYPELAADCGSLSGPVTAEAIALSRDRAADKVQARRPGYDGPLARAQMMAVAIGGYRNYPGYEGFGLGSYAAGDLDHAIGDRPVFGVDPLQDIEQKSKFWEMIGRQTVLGIPLELALANNGWKPADLAKLAAARAASGGAGAADKVTLAETLR